MTGKEFAAVFVPLVVAVSVVWLAFLIWSNVRQRKTEIGILSAMGLPARSILFLFIGKAVIVGLAGSLVGFVFQQFHLIPYLTVLENVMAPTLAAGS